MNSHQRRKHRRRFRHSVAVCRNASLPYVWDIEDWCRKKFGIHKYWVTFDTGYWVYNFDNPSNAMLFTLQWAGEVK
jgi:hypothetical protein